MQFANTTNCFFNLISYFNCFILNAVCFVSTEAFVLAILPKTVTQIKNHEIENYINPCLVFLSQF